MPAGAASAMAAFEAPPWAAEPTVAATLRVASFGEEEKAYDVGRKPWVVLGRNGGGADIVIEDPSVSRLHCALVHHQDGRLYLIDLSSHGTTVDGEPIKRHKPTKVKDGFQFALGKSDKICTVSLGGGGGGGGGGPASPSQRRGGGEEDLASPSKRPRAGQVRVPGVANTWPEGEPFPVVAHLLLKHTESRNPKVRDRRDGTVAHRVTRSRSEATEGVLAIRAKLAAVPSAQRTAAFLSEAERMSECSSWKQQGAPSLPLSCSPPSQIMCSGRD